MKTKDMIRDMTLIAVEVSVWGGERQTQLQQLGEERHIKADLPPETVAKSLSKKVISTERLKPFRRLRAKAHDACLAVGTQMKSRSGIYAIGNDQVAGVMATLEELETEFLQEKANFVANYLRYVQEWVEKFPEWADWIQRSTLSLDEVEKRFGFEFWPTKLAEDGVDGRLAKKVESLGSTLLEEVAAMAESSWTKTLRKKSADGKAGQRVLGPLRKMRTKLAACRFMNPVSDDAIVQIDKLFASLPKTGDITGTAFKDLEVLTLRFAKGDFKIPDDGDTDLALEALLESEQTEQVTTELLEETVCGEDTQTDPDQQTLEPPPNQTVTGDKQENQLSDDVWF